MKILVIGDTHGKLKMVRDIWTKLTGIDLIIHTGDYYTDAQKLQDEMHVPVVYVKGNCDGSRCSTYCSPEGGDFAIVETECGNILVTHGHMENVKYSYDNLVYKALENDCMAVVFGHTHRAVIDEVTTPAGSPHGTVRLVNPGSLTLPRDGSGGTYAIIRTDEESFNAAVVYYTTIMGGGGNKKSGRTGYISSLLNYSDRF